MVAKMLCCPLGLLNPTFFIFISIGIAPFALSTKKLIDVYMCYHCQGHKKPREQRLKERSKFNFQTRNKTRLCDSKTKTQELWKKTQDVQNKLETNLYYANIWKHEHEHKNNMTRLWCKIVPKISVEQTKGNGVMLLFIPL
jgi:hypothetical protein